jgi:nucleoside 2-deoxyribosyltransferase
MSSVYLIGSLRNPEVPKVAAALRSCGHDVFDDWYAAGEKADDAWKEYEQQRNHTYIEALQGYAAQHVFQYDREHLNRCGVGVLMLPAGRSGHLELGIMLGQGKPGYILLDDEAARWDVMYNFATGVFWQIGDLAMALRSQNAR